MVEKSKMKSMSPMDPAKRAVLKFVSGDKIPGDEYKWKCAFCKKKGHAKCLNLHGEGEYQKVATLRNDCNRIHIGWIELCNDCGTALSAHIMKRMEE